MIQEFFRQVCQALIQHKPLQATGCDIFSHSSCAVKTFYFNSVWINGSSI